MNTKTPIALEQQLADFKMCETLGLEEEKLLEKYSKEIFQIVNLNKLPTGLPTELAEFIKENKGRYINFLRERKKILSWESSIEEKQTIEAKTYPDLVKKYKLFVENLNPNTAVVYHPCCANDISPSSAFPSSEVIYVDTDENSIKALQEKWMNAHIASALEFDPGNVNVLIMLNPSISENKPSQYLVPWGYIICNDYHETASSLKENKEYKIVAVIRKLKDWSIVFDDEKLEDYWTEVETDEEFKNTPFDWWSISYEWAVQIVKIITGKEENILIEYKKIFDSAKEENRKNNEQLLLENPWMKKLLEGIMDEDDWFLINYKEMQLVIPRLPKKKGNVDDLFIFQKLN
jgi:hypothetical protein